MLTALMIAAFWAQITYAATWTPLKDGVELKDRPQINGKVLIRIPAKTRLKELEKRGYWVKVEYLGRIGWIPLNDVRLVTGEAKAKLDIIHSHSKQSGRMYEHTFKIRNSGTAPFSGTVTLRGYLSSEIAFNESFTFRKRPIPVGGEREAAVRTHSDFNRLEYSVEM